MILIGDSMKKRLFIALICCGLSISLFACGKNVDDIEQSKDAIATTKEEINSAKETENDISNVEDKEELNQATETEYKQLPTILKQEDNKVILFKDGKNIEICNLTEKESEGKYYSPQEIIGDYVYVVKSPRYLDEDNSVLEVYNAEGKKVFDYVFELGASNVSFSECEGKVLVSYEGYVTSYYEGETTNKVYVFDPETRDYTYSKTYSEMLNASKELNLLYPNYISNLFDSMANDSENVYAWDARKKAFAVIDTKTMTVKESVKCNLTEENLYIENFDGDRAVVSGYDYYADTKYYIADMKTGDTELVLTKDMSFITEKDGKLYYYTDDKNAYMNKKYEIYSYDLNTKEHTLLYETQKKPGDGYITPGITDFTVQNNLILFENTDENGYFLSVYDLAKKQLLDDKFGYEESKYSKYASLDAVDEVKYFNAAGTDVKYFETYIEKVKLNSNIKNADKINADLEKVFEGILQTSDSYDEYAIEWLSELEADDLEYYVASSYDCTLSSITEIGSDYLQVDFSCYEYGGGAHGYGYSVTSLYKLSTGEPVTLKDVCGVNFETFRNILIAKTIEDWKNAEEYKYYTPYDYDPEYESEFYNILKNDIQDFDSFPVYYGSDSLSVGYNPYLYGPYSSGYIYIDISYDELGITINQ